MRNSKYDKNNNGALFKNDRKESDNHPDYKGDAIVEGVPVWISAWVKESKGGVKYMSLAFNAKEPQADPKSADDDGDSQRKGQKELPF